MFELINPYVAKILVSAKDKDSIRHISQKIQDFWDLENALHFPDAQKSPINKWNFVAMKIH